jgi:hypothetical protein
MIDRQSRFRLPLMHHLVQHGVLDLGPWVPSDVPPAYAQLERPAGADVHRELPQPGTHAARKPDPDLLEGTVEVPGVELTVYCFQPVEHQHVTRPAPLLPLRSGLGWRIGMHRELEELPLR